MTEKVTPQKAFFQSAKVLQLMTNYQMPNLNFDIYHCFICLLPFDRAGWLRTDIINYPIHLFDFVDDPIGEIP